MNSNNITKCHRLKISVLFELTYVKNFCDFKFSFLLQRSFPSLEEESGES
jgi:hypothetical protein